MSMSMCTYVFLFTNKHDSLRNVAIPGCKRGDQEIYAASLQFLYGQALGNVFLYYGLDIKSHWAPTL
jgi:hypothetical protein